MELRTQTNGTRFVKSEYSALEKGLPFFSAVYLPITTIISGLKIIAKDSSGAYQEYDYRSDYENTGDGNIPCCSALSGVEAIPAGTWIYAPTGFEFSYINIGEGLAIIY